MNDLEAPWVGREPPEIPAPVCPCCGAEAEYFYFSDLGGERVCVGCDCCLTQKHYDEVGDAISSYMIAV
jgi:hypothetical protein